MENLQELKALTQDLRVLYVEDNEKYRSSTSLYLKKIFALVVEAKNGAEGLELYKKGSFDLVITDIEMPEMDGLSMSEAIKKIDKNQIILIISAYSNTENFIKSIKLGVDGYLLKPTDSTQMNETLYKVSLKLKTFNENEEYKNHLESLVEKKTAETVQLYNEKMKNYKEILIGLVNILESRDPYTGGHSQRVAYYSKLIAQTMGYSKEECDEIFHAAILHDLGKIAIPDSVLLKPEKLTDLEFKLIKEHPVIGANLLSGMQLFQGIAKIIRHHHESYNGQGYPDGLRGDEIPVFSQIMSVADAFDAMTTSRIYKNNKSISQAIAELESLKNIIYRADIIEAAEEVLSDIKLPSNVDQIPRNEFERERFSYFYRDQLTGNFNEYYLDLVLKSNTIDYSYTYIQLIQLKNFSSYNAQHGWQEGSEILKKISQALTSSRKENVLIFRMNGDDFAIISKDLIEIDFNIVAMLLNESHVTVSSSIYNIFTHGINSFSHLEKHIS
jgi:diguanylate cyclase (GGDEF)-like protein/putative nucleotidyltransferase with HDIG domain